MNGFDKNIDNLISSLRFNDLPKDVKNAFSGIDGSKTSLKRGTSLFRFSDHNYASPWWSETTQLRNILLSAKAKGLPLYNHVRSSTAILHSFSPGLFNLLVVKLTKNVDAFRGRVAPQNEAAKYRDRSSKHHKKRFTKPIFFGGGNGQVYIPRFDKKLINKKFIDKKENQILHINLENHTKWLVPKGAISIYDDIDDIVEVLEKYMVI